MHNYDNLFLQDVKDSVVYAVLGPFSSNRSQTLETHKLDEDRVEYAKINYNVVPQNPTPVSSAEKPAKSDEGTSIASFSSTKFIESTRNGPGNDVCCFCRQLKLSISYFFLTCRHVLKSRQSADSAKR